MKLIGAFWLAALCAVAVAAQTTERMTKSKISVKDGKEVTVTGCVHPTASGQGYMLTDVADKTGALHSYMLVSDDADLSKHIGHRVEIRGKATDRGEGRIETETTTKVKAEHGEERESRAKSETSGDLAGLPFLGVRSVKMIAAVCP